MKTESYYRIDSGLIDKFERHPQTGALRIWAYVRHAGPLVYIDDKNQERVEYVTEDSLVDPEFLDQLALLPITNEHPSLDNFIVCDKPGHTNLIKGSTGSQIALIDDGVAIDGVVYDPITIDAIYNGKTDVSLGYMAHVKRDNNILYQVKAEPNHLAICDEGRAPKAGLIYPPQFNADQIIQRFDSTNKTVIDLGGKMTSSSRNVQRAARTSRGDMAIPEMNSDMKEVMIDGMPYMIDAEAADAYNKFMDGYNKMMDEMGKLQADKEDAMQQLDAMKKEMDELKRRNRPNANMDAKSRQKIEREVLATVIEKFDMVQVAKEVCPKLKIDLIKDSQHDIRKKIVCEVYPHVAKSQHVDSEHYIMARWDSLLEDILQEQEEDEIIAAEEEDYSDEYADDLDFEDDDDDGSDQYVDSVDKLFNKLRGKKSFPKTRTDEFVARRKKRSKSGVRKTDGALARAQMLADKAGYARGSSRRKADDSAVELY